MKLLTLYLKKHDSSTSTSEIVENILLFISSFGLCIYVHYFFDVVKINKRVNQKLIKRRSKVQENNMSRERALSFSKTIS